MKLDRPLIQLPVRFCAETLASEVRALPADAWMPHPQGFAGNEAVPLVSVNGEINDEFVGPMAATQHLRKLPYVMALMEELGGVWGRSRLMGLAPGAKVPTHVDIHYYWRTHIRLHIPVFTNPGVRFICAGESVHMAPGECWTFDSFELHEVRNEGDEKRIHLVLDTVGGERLFELIEDANKRAAPPAAPWIPKGRVQSSDLKYEKVNRPNVMTAWEMRCHVAYLTGQLVPNPLNDRVLRRIERFISLWHAAWVAHGEEEEGIPIYRQLIAEMQQDLRAMNAGEVTLRNSAGFPYAVHKLIFSNALMDQDGAAAPASEPAPERVPT